MRDRRVKIVAVSPELFLQTMRIGGECHAVRCVEGVPADAEYLGMIPIQDSLAVGFLFRHESFEQVPEDARIPLVYVAVRRIDRCRDVVVNVPEVE